MKIVFVFLAKLCFYASWSCVFNQHAFLGVLINFDLITWVRVRVNNWVGATIIVVRVRAKYGGWVKIKS